MYGFLFQACKNFEEQNARKPNEDKINRRCNRYAVKHTVNLWREQYKKKKAI